MISTRLAGTEATEAGVVVGTGVGLESQHLLKVLYLLVAQERIQRFYSEIFTAIADQLR